MQIANCGGLKIDGTTLYEENGILKAQSGGSGVNMMVVNFTWNGSSLTADYTPTQVYSQLYTKYIVGKITYTSGESYSRYLILTSDTGGLAGTEKMYFCAFKNNEFAVITYAGQDATNWEIMQD